MYKLKTTISDDIANAITAFAIKNHKTIFTPNGLGRFFYIIPPIKHLLNEQQRIMLELGLYPYYDEPYFGNFIGVNLEGANVHLHTDPGKIINNIYHNHVRINFLLSKPNSGGFPIIENQIVDVNEGESWVNVADKWQHQSTTVIGDKPRIVLSLGSLVSEHVVDYFLNNINH